MLAEKFNRLILKNVGRYRYSDFIIGIRLTNYMRVSNNLVFNKYIVDQGYCSFPFIAVDIFMYDDSLKGTYFSV